MTRTYRQNRPLADRLAILDRVEALRLSGVPADEAVLAAGREHATKGDAIRRWARAYGRPIDADPDDIREGIRARRAALRGDPPPTPRSRPRTPPEWTARPEPPQRTRAELLARALKIKAELDARREAKVQPPDPEPEPAESEPKAETTPPVIEAPAPTPAKKEPVPVAIGWVNTVDENPATAWPAGARVTNEKERSR